MTGPGNILIDFEVRGYGNRTAAEIMAEITRNFLEKDTVLKKGDFGFFAEHASLEPRTDVVPSVSLPPSSPVIAEAQPSHPELVAKIAELQGQLASLEAALSQEKRNGSTAKEMWLKESQRASKLSDRLERSEISIADFEQDLKQTRMKLKTAEIEITNLKYLLDKFGQEDENRGIALRADAWANEKPVPPAAEGFSGSFLRTGSVAVAPAVAPSPSSGSSAVLAPSRVPAKRNGKGVLAGSVAPQQPQVAGLTYSNLSQSKNVTPMVPNSADVLYPPATSALSSPVALGGSSDLNSPAKAFPNLTPINSSSAINSGQLSKNFRYLLNHSESVLFEDENLQIGLKSEYSGLAQGKVALFFGNKSGGVLQSFSAIVIPPADHQVSISNDSPVPGRIGPKQQIPCAFSIVLHSAYEGYPTLKVAYLLGDNSPREHIIPFPIPVSKFCQGKQMELGELLDFWRDALLGETSAVVNVGTSVAKVSKNACLGGALMLHTNADPSPDTLVLVGQFPADTAEGVKCATVPEATVVVRIELGRGRARVAVRSHDPVLAEGVKKVLSDLLTE